MGLGNLPRFFWGGMGGRLGKRDLPAGRGGHHGVTARRAWDRGRILSQPACINCGVCCFSKLASYVRVSGADWDRLGDEAEQVAHFIGHRAYMKMTDSHCEALKPRQTPDGRMEFFCAVYEKRPQVCRDLARGSAACEGELAAKADRVARHKA